MKNISDLEKIWRQLALDYKVKYEVLSKPYPNSIIPWSPIVNSMWLFVYVNDWKLTSWRLDSQCNDEVFNISIEDLKNKIKEVKFWVKTKKENILPF